MDSKVLGYIFRELRRQSGLTLRELSERVDIDYSYISKLETGAAAIQPHHLAILTHYYHIKESDLYRECQSFFGDLRKVLNANLCHHPNRIKLRTSFVEKYEYLRISRYLPYIHFVELENMAYSGVRDKYFVYLIETLDETLLVSPYRYFCLFRKLYWACQQHDIQKVKKYTNLVEDSISSLDKNYQPYGYHYLLAGCAVLGDNIKITKLYNLAYDGFIRLNNLHFAMLADITYGGYLVTHRDYIFSIRFNRKLLNNENYTLTTFSKRSILFNIGEAYLQLGDYRSALQYYTQSLEFAPQKSCAFFTAFCMLQVGKRKEALKLLDTHSAISEDNPLFTELLTWLRKFAAKRKFTDDDVIQKLVKIENKYESKIDYCLRLLLLKIKIDFYKDIGNLQEENRYLHETISELRKR